MAKMKVKVFAEIKNYSTPALRVGLREYLRTLNGKVEDLEVYSVKQPRWLSANELDLAQNKCDNNTRLWHFRTTTIIALLFSVIIRFVVYPIKARKQFIYDGINYIFNASYSNLLLLAPSKCPAVIHCRGLYSWLPPKARDYSLERGGWLRYFFIVLFKKPGLKKADHIIATSEYTRQELKKHMNIPLENISVVHDAINHRIFRPRDKSFVRKQLNIDINEKVVLSVASKIPVKNIERLIEAFFIVTEQIPETRLIHIGGLSKKSQRLIKKFGLESRISTFGYLPHEKLSLYYNAADVFIFPSLDEGFGIPLVEAMASCCPVVASNRASIPEVLKRAGIIIEDPQNPNAIAREIKKVLLNPLIQKELARKGIDRAADFYWERSARKLVSVFRKVLKEKI